MSPYLSNTVAKHLLGAVLVFTVQSHAGNWPQWRGPNANGTASDANPPLTWSETENVKWKADLPGFGTSTPIVWEDHVFILTAIAENEGPRPNRGPHRFAVLCLDRKDGSVRWQKNAREEAPHERHHADHGYASASPITDGKLVIAYFGSRGLHCYDFAGNLKWSKDLGRMRTRNSFGEGASPALHGDTLVVNWDDEGDNDFVAAFDKNTGKELWRTPRNEPTGWSTPLIVEFERKHQAVVNATGKVRSYDLVSGKEIWSCGGQTANCIPSPVADKDTVYVTSGFRGSALYAIALGHSGELDGTEAIRWSRSKNTPYVPSPLLVDGLVYTITMNNGVLSCVDSRTGNPHFEGQGLDGVNGVYASPVSAKDRVYVLGRDGSCVVLKKGPQFEILGRSKVEDKTDASLALVDDEVFIRGHRKLYCIAEAGSGR